jgi:branched-subunit amino acid transport protein AzlD
VHIFGEHKFAVLTALLIGLVLRVVFLIETPFNQPEQIGRLSSYNDEAAHVGFTKYILETGSLPRHAAAITKEVHGELPTFENYQSPLYYILHAALCKTFGAKTPQAVAYVGRALSLAIMLLLFLIGMKIVSALGKQISSQSAALFAIFLSLSGVFVKFSTQAGNELLAWLCAGWLTWAFIEHERYASPRNLAWLSIAFILGLYSKLSILLAFPLIALVLFRCLSNSKSRAIIGATYLIVGITPLALYNYFTFGSAIPLAAGFGTAEFRFPDLNSLLYAARSAVFPWSELWQSWKGLLLFTPALILLAGVVWGIMRSLNRSKWAFPFFTAALAGFLWLNFRYNQAEARYLFIAWPAFAVGIENSFVRRATPWLMVALLLIPYTLFVF